MLQETDPDIFIDTICFLPFHHVLTSWFFQYLHVEEYIYEISGEVIKVVVVAREIQPLKGSSTVQHWCCQEL